MLVALFIEFITFNVMGLGTFPEMIRFDLLFIGIVALFIFILPSFKLEAVLIILMLVLQSALSFVNEAMYDDPSLNTVFTLDQLMAATSLAGVFTDEYVSWPFLIGLIIIVSAEFLFLLYLRRIKVKSQLKARVQLAFFMVFIFLLTGIGSSYGYVYNKLYSPVDASGEFYLTTDDKKLFSDTDYSLKLKAFKRFGTFAFYYKNLYNTLNVDGTESLKTALTAINKELGEDFKYNNPTAYTGAYEGNNLIMIMLESAEWFGIDKELTPTLYALSEGAITSDTYLSKNKTNQSEMISILGSFPVKTNLQAELETDVKKDQVSYPFALPSVLKREGYTTSYIHNNYEEFYNREKTHNALGFDRLYFHEQVELENEYKTSDDFYDLESDYEFFKSITKNGYINPQGQPFMSFFTTLSMHGNYDDLNDFIHEKGLNWDWDYNNATMAQRQSFENDPDTNEFLYQYYDSITKADFLNKFGTILKNLDLTDRELHTTYLRYKHYQAAYMDLDRGVNVLINDLYQKGQLQNTTIVLFADHDSYYHTLNYTLRGLDTSEYYNLDLYSVPFIMYDGSVDLKIDTTGGEGYTPLNYQSSISKKIDYTKSSALAKEGERVKINKWFSTYDFVPTMLDLFGYKYNANLYHGVSVFDDTIKEVDRHVFISYESGTYNDTFFVAGDGIFYHVEEYNGKMCVFRIDEADEVLFWEQVKGTKADLDDAKKLTESTDQSQYAKLIAQKRIFERQWENYRASQAGIFEKLYDYKFFLYGDVVDSKNQILYPYANIDINILKR